MSQVDDNAEKSIQKILIANKSDLTYEREVSKNEGEALAKKYGIKYIETSAKTDKNINLAFENLALDVYLAVKNGNIQADADASRGVKVGDYYVEEPKLMPTLNSKKPRGDGRNIKLNAKKASRKKKEEKAKSGCCN